MSERDLLPGVSRPFSHGILLLAVILTIGVDKVWSECPQDVTQQAYRCFTAYSSQLQNMQNSRRPLCCGVDVETLRAFCSSFVYAMTCIHTLKEECPSDVHDRIDRSLINLQGAQEGLKELCSDDRLYELYARHQTCFINEGQETVYCFQRYMNTSVRLMSRPRHKSSEELCRNMRQVVSCMQTNVRMRCGEEAAQLVERLVKPMVRDSTKCDYSIKKTKNAERPVVTHRPSGDQGRKDQYITDRHSSRGNGKRNGARSVDFKAASLLLFVILMQILW